MTDELNGAIGSDSSSSMKNAFDKSIKALSNIASPLVIIGILKDFNEAVMFITEHLLISLILAGILLFLFLFYLLNNRKPIDTGSVKTSTSKEKQSRRTKVKQSSNQTMSKKPRLNVLWIIVTTIAIALIGTIFSLFTFTGVHYVMIASYQEPTASNEGRRINEYISQNNLDGIKIFVNKSKGENPYKGLMVNGPHFSKKSALKSYELSKKYLQNFMAKDPQLISHYLFKKSQFINLATTKVP